MSRSLRSLFLSLILVASQAAAQTPNSVHTDAGISAQFRQAVMAELDHYKNGLALYSHSERFHFYIDHKVAQRLGFSSKGISTRDESTLTADTNYRGDISKTTSDEDETTVAISRRDPNLIVAGANDDEMYTTGMPAYVSTNGGVNWKTYRLPPFVYRRAVPGGDPMITSDDQGTFYYAFLIYSDNSDNPSSNIMVARSTDGKNWFNGIPVIWKTKNDSSFEDKETIGVDMDHGSPHYGRVYVVWMQFDSVGMTTQQIAWSDDGAQTWSAPNLVSSDYGEYSLVRVGKGGTVFVSSSGASMPVHAMHVSYDGGQTFEERDIASFKDYPTNQLQYSGLKGDAGFRAFPYVSFDVDLRNNRLDAVYGTWENDKYGALYTLSSSDEGQSWSDPTPVVQVNAKRDHFLPWLCTDQVLHKSHLAFYSSETDVQNVKAQFMHSLFDDPVVFNAVGISSFNPLILTTNGEPFLGDYVGADAYDGHYVTCWTQNRPGGNDGEVYAYVSSSVVPTGSVTQLNAHTLEISNASPNPVLGGSVHFTLTSDAAEQVSYQLVDMSGREVLRGSLKIDPDAPATLCLPLDRLSAGVYYVNFTGAGKSWQRQIVALH